MTGKKQQKKQHFEYPISLNCIDYRPLFPVNDDMGAPEILEGFDGLSKLLKDAIKKIKTPRDLDAEQLEKFETILRSFSVYPTYAGRCLDESLLREYFICTNRFGPATFVPNEETNLYRELFGRRIRKGEPLVKGFGVYNCLQQYLHIDQKANQLIILPEKKI
jgi:hypothetical protein